jgi:uncharacterized protein involved in exopolysaccharide biosynthesis
MNKFIATIVCFLILCGAVFGADAARPVPRKSKFDWQKAEAERQKLREKFRAEHKKYVEKLKEFHKRFVNAKTEQEKNAIRSELNDFLAKEVNRRLERSRKRIDDMKKNVEKLEEEQKNMQNKAPDFIKKRTDEVLQGKIIPGRRHSAK